MSGVDSYYDQTFFHPIGLFATLILGGSVFLVKRKYALVPLLVILCFVPIAQRLTILSLDFNVLRLLIVAGWLRLLFRGEMSGMRWCRLDALFLAWSLSATIVFTILWGERGFFNRSGGYLFEQFGTYVLVRYLVRDWEDVATLARAAALIAAPCMVLFLVEWASGRNVFSVFGGVPELTAVRHGRLRCQGPFSHPIIAGSFWAAWIPLIAALSATTIRDKWLSMVGLTAVTVIVGSTASSTPVFAAVAAVVGISAFKVRHAIRVIQLGALVTLVGLHFAMAKPVWHLFARISAVGGSTGYHRYLLIDNFIKYFDDWWIAGLKSTEYWGFGQHDVTNHYIVQGVCGGLITFILFLALIAGAFSVVGRAWRSLRNEPTHCLLAWAVGAAIFTHCMAFFGVSYFGQAHFIWALHLGLVGAVWQFTTVGRLSDSQVMVGSVPPETEAAYSVVRGEIDGA
jgi:hypothetical protein